MNTQRFIGSAQVAGVASEYAITQLWNAADSGVTAKITKLIMDIKDTYFHIQSGAVENIGVAQTKSNKLLGGSDPQCTWKADSFGTGPLVITGVTKHATTATVTYTGTDPVAGVQFGVTGVVGMVELNGNEYQVGAVNSGVNTFLIMNTDGSKLDTSGFTTYVSDGLCTMVPKNVTTRFTSYIDVDARVEFDFSDAPLTLKAGMALIVKSGIVNKAFTGVEIEWHEIEASY